MIDLALFQIRMTLFQRKNKCSEDASFFYTMGVTVILPKISFRVPQKKEIGNIEI